MAHSLDSCAVRVGGLLCLALATCANETAPARPAGHVRMVELLKSIALAAEADNPYVGQGQPVELRARLADLPAEGPDLRRWLFNRLLAKHELRLDRNEEAIGHAREAYAQLELFADQIPAEEAIATVFEVGVAYLRYAEDLNCAQRHTAESCLLPIRGGGVHVDKTGSTAALRYFQEVLERTVPDSWWHVKARWLLNLAYMTLDRYPDGVPEKYRIAPSAFASEIEFPEFPEIAPRLGLDSFDMAGGVIADDFDADGLLDLMISSSDPRRDVRLFRSQGDGRFVERTAEAGLTGLWGGLNMNQADYDNDGDLDVLILRGAWWRDQGLHPNSLLRNNGDGTFDDLTFEAGLGDVRLPTQCASWADYDLDGDLDLYIGNESDQNVDAPGQLFRNAGDGTFVDVASSAGVADREYAKAAAWGDYDGDRYPDLYVTNLGNPNRLYHNNGDGTFTDVAQAAGVELPLAAFPVWFWDFDNDGALDLYVAGYGGRNLPPEVGFVAASYLGLPHKADMARLYRGDGRGGFVDVAAERGLTRVTLPMGANFGDVDNDGFLDFYLGTGYPYFEGLMPNLLFVNRGGRRFFDVTTASRTGHLQKGHGIAFADLDNDGDQDIYAQMGGMYPADAFGNALFENPGFGNHWIKIRLVGVRSNRFGVGSRIRLVLRDGADAAPRTVYRHVNSGGAFGANPLRVEIGLGAAERIELLEVYWPASDTTQSFTDVAADQWIEIREDGERPVAKPLRRLRLGG